MSGALGTNERALGVGEKFRGVQIVEVVVDGDMGGSIGSREL